PFGEKLLVRVVDTRNQPIEGATMNWSETTGSGAALAESTTSRTDLAGVASMKPISQSVSRNYGYTLSNIRASVSGNASLIADFKLSVTPGSFSGNYFPSSSVDAVGLRGAPGALLPARIVAIYSQVNGPLPGQDFPNLGFRIYVDPSTASN